MGGLSAADVTRFALEGAELRKGQAPDLVTPPAALRSLLRFLRVAGLIAAPLADAVPAGRGYPRLAFAAGRPAAASGRCWRPATACVSSATGAVTTRSCWPGLLAQGGEVAGLDSGDVDWRAAEVTVRGKGNWTDVLPLPADVGEAVAAYLLHARPSTASRALFVTMVALFARLGVPSVTRLHQPRLRPRRGGQGSGRTGCATPPPASCRRPGASMEDIGQLLRARPGVDHGDLRECRPWAYLSALALPCPGGAAR